jgi:hypothetical protein
MIEHMPRIIGSALVGRYEQQFDVACKAVRCTAIEKESR